MSRPDLVLHIGLSKTGTSSIQRCLGARREELLAEGVLYPRSPGAANHGLLPASLVPVSRLGHFHPNIWEGLSPEHRLDRFRREFAVELDGMGPQVRLVILSAEQCGGLLKDPGDIARLRDLLAPYVAATRVVVYLRRQDQHFASGYTQALRVAHIRPPGLPSAGPRDMRDYDYAALLDRWAAVFGDSALVPKIFERSALLNGDVVDDFLALCGIGLRVPPDDPDRQSNLSVTPGGLGLMLAMGRHLEATLPGGLKASSALWRRFVQSASEALPGRGWRPVPAEAAAFLARFATVNEAVRRRWFPDRPALFTTDDLDATATASAPDATAFGADEVIGAACALLAHEIAGTQAREAQRSIQEARRLERAGDAAAARRHYNAALRSAPDHPDAHLGLGALDAAAGDTATAGAHMEALRQAGQTAQAERLERLLRRYAKQPAAR